MFKAYDQETNDEDMAILFAALANNKSLVDFDLEHCTMSDDNWTILCESLQGHPTLTSLGLFHRKIKRRTGHIY
jgi:hypothetical protein